MHQTNVHGIPSGNVIFFVVDFDAIENMIDSTVLSYFEALKDKMDPLRSPYIIGVYGNRTTSRAVISKHYAVTSFVSDMSSTGYSGSMGYRIPDNWTYDQLHEYSIGDWDLDKVAYSGQIPAVGSLLGSPVFVEETTRNIRDGDTFTY